ncbi:hypothetical protein VN97_g4659 [Penicillium thymicola]|uniref:Uncharacterized protein n=1 Tax=Penicillium thymicola TaxID=293382 RepID=A0AAI9X9Y3_PENTH|nr:hypothetical protein VN97_g4659 [Penicillium thymicola]
MKLESTIIRRDDIYMDKGERLAEFKIYSQQIDSSNSPHKESSKYVGVIHPVISFRNIYCTLPGLLLRMRDGVRIREDNSA